MNAVAGTLIVANTYAKVGRGFTAFQSGMLSLGYLVAVLAMIRVGEKILQRVGARKPMQWGASITTAGIAMMGLTFLPDLTYTVVVFVAFGLLAILAIVTLIPKGIGRAEDEMEKTEMAVSESYNQ